MKETQLPLLDRLYAGLSATGAPYATGPGEATDAK